MVITVMYMILINNSYILKNYLNNNSKLKTDNTMLEYIQNIKYENILF
jgi:hypothetical protein